MANKSVIYNKAHTAISLNTEKFKKMKNFYLFYLLSLSSTSTEHRSLGKDFVLKLVKIFWKTKITE